MKGRNADLGLPSERDIAVRENVKRCPDDYAGLITERLAAALDLSLENPKFVSPSEAHYMRDDDMVAGVRLGDETRCYPFWIWDYHHTVNDEWSGHHVFLAG